MITNGSSPGLLIVPGPRFPDETTTVIPAAHARSTAAFNGSIAYGWTLSVPNERFNTLIPYCARCVTTHWSAAITTETSVDPSGPATLTETSFAPGATPRHLPSEAAPLPAITPARCVPCPYASSPPASGVKSTRATTRSPRSSTCATPVSIIATVTPVPSMPAGTCESRIDFRHARFGSMSSHASVPTAAIWIRPST